MAQVERVVLERLHQLLDRLSPVRGAEAVELGAGRLRLEQEEAGAAGLVGMGPQELLLRQQTLEVVVAGEAGLALQQYLLVAMEVQALSSLNTPTHSPSPIQAVVSLTRPQLLAGLLSQHLLPVRAMFLGVNDGTLRIP
jgi:hypothetical protein